MSRDTYEPSPSGPAASHPAPSRAARSGPAPSGPAPSGPAPAGPAPGAVGSLEPPPSASAPAGAGIPPGAGTDPGQRSEPPGPRESGDRASLLRLLAIVAAVVAVAILAGVGKTVAIVGALILFVMLHELGHFLTAKRAGMKVTEYFLGFGPRLWSIRRGETEYGVKALPFGGYVKILGMTNAEEVDPADEPRTYRQKPYLSRLSVAVAGSAMHFLLALVLLVSFFYITGQPGQPTFQVASLYRLSTGPSPAQEAGFQVGDRIVSVDGKTFANTGDQGDYIRSRPGQRLDVLVDRHGQLIHLYPTPIDLSKVSVEGASIGPAPTQPTGFIGIGYQQPLVHYGFLTSLNKTGGAFVDISARTFDALGNLVTAHGIHSYGQMLVSQKAADSPNATTRFVSPVGFVRIANQAAQNGASDVISILVLINIFIGIFNLLPLLPLDGGHVAVATYEAIRSRKGRAYHADVTKLMPLTYAVFLVLVFIGVSALFLDVRDLLSVVRL